MTRRSLLFVMLIIYFADNQGSVVSQHQYLMSPYHVLWPIPQASISSNTKGVINQNFGYSGYENNVPPLTVIPPEDDN